jgi:hypothetical protein
MKEDVNRPKDAEDHDMKASERKSQHIFTRWLLAAAVVIVIVVILAFFVPVSNGTMQFELLKLIIQFFLIVALGALVAVGVEAVKRQMDSEARARQYDIETLTSMLAGLDAAYQAIKRERQGLAVMPPSMITYDQYMATMARLRDSKQNIEQIVNDMKACEPWMPSLVPIRSLVSKLEKSLEKLETEWESASQAPEKFNHEKLPQLKLFRAKYTPDLKTSYDEARTALIRLLAEKHDRVPMAGSRSWTTLPRLARR